jgi:hypothetical protein
MNDSDNIKTQIPLAKYLTDSGHIVKKHGSAGGVSPCPMCGHKDCFRFDPDTNLYKCFSCESAGSVIDLHMALSGLDFLQSIKFLARQYKISMSAGSSKGSPPAANPAETALAYYQTLRKNEAFNRFLKHRNFSMADAEKFSLGYADGNLHLHGKKHLKALEKAGLVRRNKNGSAYDLFKNMIVYPYFRNGVCVHLKGKEIKPDGSPTGRTWQMPGKRPVYNGDATAENGVLYLAEGENDVIALSRIGITARGLGGKPDEAIISSVLQDAKKHDTVLAFDNDDAGELLTQQFENLLEKYRYPEIIRSLQNISNSCTRAKYRGADPDEAVRIGGGFRMKKNPPPLKECLTAYYRCLAEDDSPDTNIIGGIIYEWLDAKGKFFVNKNCCYLIYSKKQYEVGGNLPFRALIYNLAGINYAKKNAKEIWEALMTRIYNYAVHSDNAGWIYTDYRQPLIGFNLQDGNIAMLRPGKVSIQPNGANEFNIFLPDSPKTSEIGYTDSTDPRQAVDRLLKLTRLTACAPEWQNYIAALCLNIIFTGKTRARGINRFSGNQGSGKTEAAGMLTTLMYGESFVTNSSTASDYSDAALNPLTILDNLELRNLTDDRQDFLLTTATGIIRQKRKSGTESANTYERAETHIITTSIEGFEIPELVQRTIDIPFASKYFSADYPGSITIEQDIRNARNEILSGLLKIAADIIGDFDERRQYWLSIIRENRPVHARSRLNEFIASQAVCLEILIRYSTDITADECADRTEKILMEWIEQQEENEAETTLDTNPILLLLDAMYHEWQKDNMENYNIRPFYVYSNGADFLLDCTMQELFVTFGLVGRFLSVPMPYKSPRHISVRIRNERSVLEKGGWQIDKKKIVNGRQIYSFIRRG